MTPEQEAACIRQTRADPRAFVCLYDHYFARVQAYVCYRVHGKQDAEDIIAETFLKAMRGLRDFRPHHRNSFTAWLFRLAHNLIVDYYRRARRSEVPYDPLIAATDEAAQGVKVSTRPAPLPEEALTQQETFQQMRALIATLSPRRQEVITLRFFAELDNQEIAKVLGLDERTVASHLSRGLKDLRERYSRQTSMEIWEEVRL